MEDVLGITFEGDKFLKELAQAIHTKEGEMHEDRLGEAALKKVERLRKAGDEELLRALYSGGDVLELLDDVGFPTKHSFRSCRLVKRETSIDDMTEYQRIEEAAGEVEISGRHLYVERDCAGGDSLKILVSADSEGRNPAILTGPKAKRLYEDLKATEKLYDDYQDTKRILVAASKEGMRMMMAGVIGRAEKKPQGIAFNYMLQAVPDATFELGLPFYLAVDVAKEAKKLSAGRAGSLSEQTQKEWVAALHYIASIPYAGHEPNPTVFAKAYGVNETDMLRAANELRILDN